MKKVLLIIFFVFRCLIAAGLFYGLGWFYNYLLHIPNLGVGAMAIIFFPMLIVVFMAVFVVAGKGPPSAKNWNPNEDRFFNPKNTWFVK